MAKAKRLMYKDMNEDQREKAERAAKKYGIPVEKVKMTATGLIVNDFAKDVEQMKQEMVATGWADSVAEVSDVMMDRYVTECNEQGKAPKKLR